MRFSISLIFSIFLHLLIIVGLYILNDNFRVKEKAKIISLSIDTFSIEKVKTPPKPIIKKNVPEKIKKTEVKKEVKHKVEKKIAEKTTKKIIKKPVIQKKIIKTNKQKPKKIPIKKERKKELVKKPKEKKLYQKIETNKSIIKNKKPENTIVSKPATTSQKLPLPIKKVNKKKSLSNAQMQSFLKKIYDIIYQHKKYPSRAKRLNIQGEVIINFVLLANGNISDIKILKSSGAKFLDKHTINTIMEASSFFPKPKSKIEIKIPVKYSLK